MLHNIFTCDQFQYNANRGAMFSYLSVLTGFLFGYDDLLILFWLTPLLGGIFTDIIQRLDMVDHKHETFITSLDDTYVKYPDSRFFRDFIIVRGFKESLILIIQTWLYPITYYYIVKDCMCKHDK